jgi:heterotetrameric sarcosine oxidase gamma subunit
MRQENAYVPDHIAMTKAACVQPCAGIACVRISSRSTALADASMRTPLSLRSFDEFTVAAPWPDSWLLLSETLTPAELVSRARQLTGDPDALVVDLSDFYETFDISGSEAMTVLAAGSAVDFKGTAPPIAAATRLAHFDVLVAYFTTEHFRILVPRSYAGDLAAWLTRAAKYATAGRDNPARNFPRLPAKGMRL